MPDTSNAIVRPPIAWVLAFAIGLGLDWLYPLKFLPVGFPRAWIGSIVFAAGFALLVFAIVTIRRAGTEVQTSRPTTAIVADGPYGWTRNPIYAGMILGLVGAAIGFDTLWILVALIAFYLVIRYGVIAREEAYLERKFGEGYLGYKSRVRRWV